MSIGDFISGIFGSKNEDKVKDVAKPVNVDPNAYQYGGQPGGAAAAANQYGQQATSAQGRQAAQADFSGAQPNMYRANQWDQQGQAWDAQSQQARQGQSQVANMQLARAMGQVPSIAGQQAHQDIAQLQQNAAQQSQQAQAAQGAQAASARGAAGVALAGQTAANNTANAQSAIGRGAAQATQNISNQAQVNAANERMQAEQGAQSAFNSVRGGDQSSQGLSQNQSQISGNQALGVAGLGSQQQQFNAGLRQQQGQQNDQYSLGMTQAQMGVNNAQLGAQENQQAQQSANTMGAYGINAGVGGQNAAMNQSNSLSLIGLATKGAGGVAGAMAKGGPVEGGKPYLVGEHGPEIVVPHQSATVIPHPQTQRIINVAPQIIDDKPDDWDGRIQPNSHPGAADTVLATWGNKPGMTKDYANASNEVRADRAERQNQNNAWVDKMRGAPQPADGGMAVEGFSPGTGGSPTGALQRADEERIALSKAKQAEGVELSDAERRRLGGANFRTGNDRKAAPKATLASRLGSAGDDIMKAGAGVDTSYHGGGGGYAPPQLIQIAGPRAGGGPVTAGQPYLVGEQGPELMAPRTGIGMDAAPKLTVPGAAMIDLGGGGGGKGKSSGPTAAPGMQDDVSKSWEPQQGTGYGGGGVDGEREDGGPVEEGKKYLAGEKGPELVVPQREMKSFQRDEGKATAAKSTTIGQIVAGLMHPTSMVLGGIPAGVAEKARQSREDTEYAGSKPTRGLAKAMGGGAKQLETSSAETTGRRSYDSPIPDDMEPAYQAWMDRYAPNGGDDYDYRGAFKAGVAPDPQTGHWPDTYKKPSHETFSDESIYATGPDAAKAGRWEGETFIPPAPKQYADGPSPLPPPKQPPTESIPEDKPQPGRDTRIMSRASITRGRRK